MPEAEPQLSRLLCLLLAALSACKASPIPADTGRRAGLSISGIVYKFGGDTDPVAGATVCVLEEPNRICAQSGSDGRYSLPLLLRDGEVTPVTVTMGEWGYPTMRTTTLYLDDSLSEEGRAQLQSWHLQSVVGPLFEAYKALVAAAANEPLSPSRCHVAGTVTDYEKAHHYTSDAETGEIEVDYEGFLDDRVHGFAGAKVTLLAAESGWTEVEGHGPVYSNEEVIPVPQSVLSVTSIDGGFFFYNLPEGEYRVVVEDTRSDHDLGYSVAFNEPLYLSCTSDPSAVDPGVFVNACPPQIHVLEEVLQ